MPFYIVPDELDPASLTAEQADERNYPVYSDRGCAYQDKGAGQKVVYVLTMYDRRQWQRRERNRFEQGDYQHVPWHGTEYAERETVADHFVHVSVDHPAMVAYTVDDESGYQDKQTRLKPGRYLERFYSDVPTNIRQAWIAQCTYKAETLGIATSPDDIETVYRKAQGFVSCMGPETHVSFDYEWPVRVYGDSDLAVAYLGPMDGAKARCVIWPDKKRYSRVYGSGRLQAMLEAHGYESGSMHGARVRALRCDSGWVMPYVDGVSAAENKGQWHVLGRGDISCDQTTGYTDVEPETETCEQCGDECESTDSRGHCDHCAEARTVCEHCDHVFFDSENPQYCESCEDSRSYCECCESDTWGDTFYSEAREENVCEDCATSHDESKFTCKHCDCVEYEWKLSQDDQKRRIGNDTALKFCEDCEDLTVCHVCESTYEADETEDGNCPSCDAAPRCELTGDLPLDGETGVAS